METCNKKKIINIILNVFLLIIFVNFSYAEVNFENIKDKKVSYLDFFLLKYENELVKRSANLRSQILVTRVQYSAVNIKVNFEKKIIVLIPHYMQLWIEIDILKKNMNKNLETAIK